MDILDIFLDILLKPPQPLMGLFFFGLSGFRFMANRVIFDIGRVVDKACIYTMKGHNDISGKHSSVLKGPSLCL